MKRKPREEYEMDIKGIEETTLLETSHRIFEMLKLQTRILLDIREMQIEAREIFDKGMKSCGGAGTVGEFPLKPTAQ